MRDDVVQAAERRTVTANSQADLVTSVVSWHVEAAAEAKRRREEAMRQRLAALKSSDMAAYLDMVRSTANSKVQELLQQTDSCLNTLAQKLAKAGAKVDFAASAEEQGSNAGGCGRRMARH
jgi:L-lactate utilization protein LutB